MTARPKRPCPRCRTLRQSAVADPDTCWICGAPLGPLPEPREVAPREPSLFEMLEVPSGRGGEA